jgi:tetratricopeptide (TPR) repeat protein
MSSMKRPALRLAFATLFGVSTLVTAAAPAGAEPSKKTRPVEEPIPAPGAEGSEVGERERAKELYEQAAAAYSARRHFEAIELFRQSAALEPSPLLSYNMALAYEEAGDLRNALKHFREYASTSDASDQEVKARIAKLESRLGKLGIQQLTVKSNPAGATLLVDGTPVGVTPYTAEFTPGAHTLSVSKPGYVDAQASVELPTDRATSVTLTLSETPRTPPKPAPAPAPPPATSPRDDGSTLARIEPLSWSLLGVGVGSLTAGVVFELSRASSEEEARKADDPVDAAEAQGAADSKHLTSMLLLGAGGAFTITGAILAVLDVSRGTPYERASKPATTHSASTSLHLSHEYQGLELTGSF